MNLIDGKKIADQILEELKKEIVKREINPCLGIILVGDNSASLLYIQKKQEAAQRIGVKVKKKILAKDVSEQEILKIIDSFNQDKQINGILVQMPLPKNISPDRIIKAINPAKDVDGFLPESGFSPPLVLAIQQALKSTGENLINKNMIALVNSDVFGKTLESKLGIKYQTQINNLEEFDVIITVLGQPGIIKSSMIKQDVILIDGGISKKNGRIIGDVDKESVKGKAKWLSPVPGGLGPMTVAFLLRNLLVSGLSNKNTSP